VSALAATIRFMDAATLIFSGIAAVGAVMAVVVAIGPLLRLVGSKHRKLDAVLQDYEKMFARLYRFVMEDPDADGHVKTENAKIFTTIADNVMYLHAADEGEAWQMYRDVHDI
jgi:hypothetical protein